MSMADCYESRYAKIAQTMRDIDRIADALVAQIEGDERLRGAKPLVRAFARAAKEETETMRTDPATFDVWPEFVACGERLLDFRPPAPVSGDEAVQRRIEDGLRLLREGKSLLTYLAGARVPMREHAGIPRSLSPVPGTPPAGPLTREASRRRAGIDFPAPTASRLPTHGKRPAGHALAIAPCPFIREIFDTVTKELFANRLLVP